MVERLGRYVLRHRIAQGGMASVYLAQLPGARDFSKWVAIKRIHPHLVEEERFVQMFLDEARLASRLHHPNVCAVLDFGEQDGAPYLVMEYLHGESLSTIMRDQWGGGLGVPHWLVARVGVDAARGLHAAHELRDDDGCPLRLVHRDVSPHNIIVTYDGVTKITDFGVAKAEGRLTTTHSGEVKGKLRYMSPEQLHGSELDARADIWALGVVLWEAALGKKLFAGSSDAEVLQRVLFAEIPAPRSVDSTCPRQLEQALSGALQRDPEVRHGTARDLAAQLESYLVATGRPTGAGAVSEWMDAHLAERRGRREALFRSTSRGDDPTETQLESASTVDRELELPGPDQPRGWLPLVLSAGLLAVAGLGLGLWLAEGGRNEHAGSSPPASPPAGRDAARSASPEQASSTPSSRESSDAAAGHTIPHGRAPDAASASSEGAAADAGADGRARSRATATEPGKIRSPDRRRRARTDRMPRGSGKLNLLAVPAAEVYLGGQRLGRTPLLDLELPAGRHVLRLEPVSGGQSRRVPVVIRRGVHTRKSLSLH